MLYEKLHCVHHGVTALTHGGVSKFYDNWTSPGKPQPIHQADFVRNKRTRVVQPNATYVSGYPPQKYGYNIPWDKEWQEFMTAVDPQASGDQPRSQGGSQVSGSRQDVVSGAASRGQSRTSSENQPRDTVRSHTRENHSRPSARSPVSERGSLPQLSRQNGTQQTTRSRYATVPTLPPIREPPQSEAGSDAEYRQDSRDNEEEPSERDDLYKQFKMTEKVMQGKIYDPGL